ncbi:transposase, partial [Haloferula sp. A504]|uniref:transposase n=1 Tax=Haloferula sp. A504 TaxID=3373601 RepID=UPI0031C2B3F0|nr:transposase [Verrucomicrobiaceae bacterium E54]
MNEKTERVRKRTPRRKLARRRKWRESEPRQRGYPPEFRLRAALMCVEGGAVQKTVAHELGISPNTLNTWVLAYRREGPESPLLRASPPP